MRFLSVKYRITLGLVAIMISTTLLVIFSGFGPDSRQATMQGRKRLCESIAVNCSVLVSRNDLDRMEKILTVLVERDDDLVSAGLRRDDDQLVFQSGDHEESWALNTDLSTETQVQVPLWSGASKWGDIEICFRPITTTGIVGFIRSPWTLFLTLNCISTFVFYVIYLGKVLRQLDPSQAIPKRVRSALDALAEGLLVTDKKGRVVLANEAFAKWAGKDADRLIGRSATTFPWKQPTDTDAPLDYPWTRALKEQSPQINHLIALTDSSNEQLTLVANSSPVLGHNGDYRGALTSFENVTELEEKKVELLNAKQIADEANQAKSDFLARMSHEIRTPMNAILGYTELLRRGFADSEQQRDQHLSTIHNSGEHLLALINDILDLSKVEAGRLELELARHSPFEVLSQVISVLHVKAEEKDLALEFSAQGKLPETILTDAVRLRQALINLVGNAIKFTDTGSVRIVARFQEHPRNLIAIDVIDTGIGMSEDACKRIFDPFSQADTTISRRFGGTGLGLSIARQLAEKMAGSITVESEIGKGTTFTMTLDPGPLDDVPFIDASDVELAKIECESTSETAQASLPPAKILVVDDGDENRKLVSLFLGRMGLEIEEAENGQIALDMASENQFDAILMDMQMPVMDGLTATKRLREVGCTTPILALTANVMKDDEENCRAAGCDGFLGKPINLDQLVSTLRRVLPEGDTAEPTVGVRTEQTANLSGQGTSEKPSVAKPKTLESNDRVSESSNNIDNARIVSSLPLDDPEFQEIIEQFAERLRDRVVEMRKCATNQDFKQLANMAHWLKGAGGTVGFDAFTEPSAALQTSAENADQAQVERNLAEIESLVSRIQCSSNDASTVNDGGSVQCDDDIAEIQQTLDDIVGLSDDIQNQEPIYSSLPTEDPEFREIVEGFASRLPQKVAEMKQTAHRRDFAELAESAHWLKGAGGTVGFDMLTGIAAALQSSAESGDEEKIAGELKVIDDITRRIGIGHPSQRVTDPTAVSGITNPIDSNEQITT